MDQMYVNACKSENPERRLKSIRRRNYLKVSEAESLHYTIQSLVNIVDKYCPMTVAKVLEELSDGKYWYENPASDMNRRKLIMLINQIGFSNCDTFGKDYVAPARFRK